MPRVASAAVVIAGALMIARLCWIAIAREPFGLDNDRPHRVADVFENGVLQLESGPLVRLSGIVVPDRDADAIDADEAIAELRERANNREVRLEFDRNRRDDRRRYLVRVYVGEQWLNEELVRAGHATADRNAPFGDGLKKRLAAAEAEARRERRGIWRRTPSR